MKRVLSIVLTLSVIFSMMTGITSYGAEEIVYSESFENGLEGWSFGKAEFKEKIMVVKDDASDGKASLKVLDDVTDVSLSIQSKLFPAQAGVDYTVSADFKILEGNGASGKIYLRFKDSAGKILLGKSKIAKETSWTNISNRITAPEGTASAEVVITGQAEYLGVTLIDNIKVVKGVSSTGQTTASPSISNEKGTVYSESFENGDGIWKTFSKDTADKIKLTTEKATDGKNSYFINDDSDKASTGIISDKISINPGATYTFYADVFTVAGTLKLYIKTYDKDKKIIDSKSSGISALGEWKTGKVSVDATEDACFAELYFVVDGSVIANGYIDNIRLVKEGSVADNPEKKLQSDLKQKLSSAKPGDIIEIPNGTYNDIRIDISQKGEEGKPITLKAKNPGKAIFKGTSNIYLKGASYISIEGLRFEECTNKSLIYFDVDTKNCFLKESAFINCDSKEGSQFQVQLRGEAITVSNCYFSGKSTVGQFIECARSESRKDVGAKHVIRNCYFGNIKIQGGNGYEAVRLGLSQTCFDDYSVVLEGCFFEKCNGESETISVKGNGTHIRYNTFYDNMGAVVLRHGDECSVYGNLFIGGAKTSRSTGVRVTGERHKVYNNYFYNMPEGSSVIFLSDGCPYEGLQNDWYYGVVDFEGYNNTIVGADFAVNVGDYSPSNTPSSNRIIAPKGKMYNNAIIAYKGTKPIMKNGDPNHQVAFENNLVYGKELGYEGDLTGISFNNFDYEIKDKYLVPANGIGADINEVNKAPKSPFEVMPQWVKADLYDTGIMKFEPVKGDPFNTEFKVEDLLPVKGKINVVINGYRKTFDVDPQLINERTMVPMRAIFEEFGAEVSWDEKTATAEAKTSRVTVKITENSSKAYVNGNETTLDSPAVIVDGRFLVPLRFISESFGARVGWADATQTAIINYSPSQLGADKGVYEPALDVKDALTIYGISFGGFNEEGNEVKNAFDGDFATKWTTKKDEQGVDGYGVFDFGASKTLESIHLAFGTGSKRNYKFSVSVSEDNTNFTTVIDNGVSSGKFEDLEKFELKGVKGRYLKLTGHGNQDNTWNNFNEIVIVGK